MTTPISRLIQKSILRTLGLGLLLNSLIIIIATPLLAADEASSHAGGHQASSAAKLVQHVREGTRKYIDVNNATAAGWATWKGHLASFLFLWHDSERLCTYRLIAL
jgi:hypothetical protein